MKKVTRILTCAFWCVKKIGNYAFDGCSRLFRIVIGSGVEEFGTDIFSSCAELDYIFYNGNKSEWSAITYSSHIYIGKVYYYSETLPATSGNYWHYDNNGSPTYIY